MEIFGTPDLFSSMEVLASTCIISYSLIVSLIKGPYKFETKWLILKRKMHLQTQGYFKMEKEITQHVISLWLEPWQR